MAEHAREFWKSEDGALERSKRAASLSGEKRPSHAEAMRQKWADPEFRKKMLEARSR